MINPSAYGPSPPAPPISTVFAPPGGGPPSSMAQPMPSQQQQQQPQPQQQQMVPPTWPATSNVSLTAPPQDQQSNLLNGNYQQQLNQAMSNVSLNPSKMMPPTMADQSFQQQQQESTISKAPNAFSNAPPQTDKAKIMNHNYLANGPLQNQYFPPQQPSNITPNSYSQPSPNGPPLNRPPVTPASMGSNQYAKPMTTNMGIGSMAPSLQTPPNMSINAANEVNPINNTSGPNLPPPQMSLHPPKSVSVANMQTNNYSMAQQAFSNPPIGQYPPSNKLGGNSVMSAGQAPPTMPLKPPQQSNIPPIPSMMTPNPGGYAAGVPLQPVMSYPPTATQQNIMPPAGYTSGYGQAMPPHPGYQQSHMAAGGMYQQPPTTFQHQPFPTQPQQQQRRLDPEQMPNPIQVIFENQHNSSGTFVTNQAGLLPPLVTTKFIVHDQGNSSPRYLRSSLYTIPTTADLLKNTALPFALILSPFARIAEGEYEPPIVDFGPQGPLRCNRCKAYMSPNMQFVDAGRRFQCSMCKVTSEVPMEYFQHLDHTGQRIDKYERPELILGTYEFLATKDYCRDNITPELPAFVFVIDVSYNTIKSGLVHLLCSQIKQILKHLPVDQGQEKSKMRVGFITFNSTVHFYNIKSSLAQPQMMVVGDVQDMFMPLLDGFLCDPEESETVIDALMDQIPKMFIDTKETENVLYPAIQAGLEAMKASNCAGKLLVFNSSLPIAEAPGKLKNRDERKLLGSDKEKTVLLPQNQVYNQLGQDCVQHGCSVDMYIFNNSYIDIATIGQVARLTGGEIYKYTYFQADVDGQRLIADIIKNVSRPIAFDAVMRVRTSAGVRPTDFFGHFYMSNTTDVELGSIDCDKAIAIEIKHDDKLTPEENIYIQVALLYTSCSGQRRLRICNLSLLVTTTIADVFKSSDLDAMMLFFAKQACFKLMDSSPKAVKDNLIHRSAQILAFYRKHCTSPTSAGQLILPESLKLLPLYILCLMKNDAISGGSDMTIDDRSHVIHFVLTMDLLISVNYLYPRFIPIHNIDVDHQDERGNEANTNDVELPISIRSTHEKISEDGAYILENGIHFFIWLGQSLPSTFIQPLFGVQCTQQVNAERFSLKTDTLLGKRLQKVIDKIMSQRTRYMRITCVRQNDKLESVFRHFLVEDRGTDGSASYMDFLCHMHKEIKELMS